MFSLLNLVSVCEFLPLVSFYPATQGNMRRGERCNISASFYSQRILKCPEFMNDIKRKSLLLYVLYFAPSGIIML